MSNIFGYMRISTAEERALQKFTRQEKALLRYEQENDFLYVCIFKEDASGKSFSNRKEWKRLENSLNPGDTVVFKDLSRFTREAENGYKKYMSLMQKSVNLVFLDNPTISTDYIRQMIDVANSQEIVTKTAMEGIIKLLLIVELDRVQRERETIVKRIKDGIEASDKKSGRVPGQVDKLTDAVRADVEKYLDDNTRKTTIASIMKKHGISRNTARKYIDIVQTEREKQKLD